jgi:hypothetical protein
MSRFVVMRDYSGHTAKKTLLEQMSREFVNPKDALSWLEFVKQQHLKKKPRRASRFFIMEIVHEEE